ncbi:MAG: Calx-beta domain-containing protein [Pyrinomonadaceae bacterium]
MLMGNISSLSNKRIHIAALLLFLFCTAIAIALTSKRLSRRTPAVKPTVALRSSGESSTTVSISAEPQSQESTQIETSSAVIAGGGGTSTAGNLTVEGTIGQPAVGTTMDGGQFSQTGGFWQAESQASPTPSPSVSPSPSPTPTSNAVQFSSSSYSVVEACTSVTITVNRIGDTSGAAMVDYFTSDVTASERRDYINAIGTLRFAAGETSKNFVVLINDDSYVEGTETLNVNLSNPSGANLGGAAVANLQIIDNLTESAANVIDDPQDFVCQQYHDFLNRQPDASGLNFWTNEITSCGTNQQCLETKRINVSAAFYLSIEFQQTGYLVERLYKTAYGETNGTSTFGGFHRLAVPIIKLNEFLRDTQAIGQGVIVGQAGWEQVLENNKQSFTSEFTQRARFAAAYPISMTSAQFVDTLNTNAGSPLSPSERDQLVAALGSGAKTRAQVLQAVAEDPDLFSTEHNRAFVLMQYFGYLRRNPNDPQDSDYTGYDFWLTKLNQFNGNFIEAEMVKAFITSIEYRQRFGP